MTKQHNFYNVNHNYLSLLPAVLRVILAEYEKATPAEREAIKLRNPDIDFSQIDNKDN